MYRPKASDFAKEARESADMNVFSKPALVLEKTSFGRYTVKLGNGGVMQDIATSNVGAKFKPGDWVTLEYYGGDWVIVGRSATRGGD